MKFYEMIIKSDTKIGGIEPSNDFEVNKLCYDSNLIENGDVFFAIKGFKSDGNKYIPEAFARGAKAVFTDSQDLNGDSRIYKVPDCRKFMAEISNIYFDYPSRKMKVIGVTGTNGKTTVTNIINFILEINDKKSGLIGTNGNIINKKQFDTTHTTPESVDLSLLLNEMVKSGVEYVTMEVSSHALDLKRIFGIDFDAAVFTNLTQEHLDFHGTMDKYFNSKKQLFDSVKRINLKGNTTAVIYNSDDEFGKKIIENSEADKISYGFSQAAYCVENLMMNFNGMNFDMLVPLNGEKIDSIKIETKLTGKFNVYNLLAAVAALKFLGISYDKIIDGMKRFKPVDGRFNQLELKNHCIAIIDYSHTPDSLLKAISTIKEILEINESKGKIITVFGCGGNRDKTKRPIMGKIATDLSDRVIITSDNSRDEDPLNIIDDIKSGVTKENWSIEINRKRAIENAINMSSKDDVILVAGKGHETYQEIKGVKYHFSDREIIEKFS